MLRWLLRNPRYIFGKKFFPHLLDEFGLDYFSLLSRVGGRVFGSFELFLLLQFFFIGPFELFMVRIFPAERTWSSLYFFKVIELIKSPFSLEHHRFFESCYSGLFLRNDPIDFRTIDYVFLHMWVSTTFLALGEPSGDSYLNSGFKWMNFTSLEILFFFSPRVTILALSRGNIETLKSMAPSELLLGDGLLDGWGIYTRICGERWWWFFYLGDYF